MGSLVIIGNGFDIWHRLPTSYWYFYNQYKDLLQEHIQYFDALSDEDAEWANFEESLGSFNEDNFHDNAIYQPTVEEMADDHTLLYGFEDEISEKKEELVSDIQNAFNDWIHAVDVNATIKLIELPTSFKFINFNYTMTLQNVYAIPENNILHIHGKVHDHIIFGHGLHQNSESPQPEVESETFDPWFEESHRTVSSVGSIFHKPVNDILELNKGKLDNLGMIKNIIVIGHSVNSIDIPYFQYILSKYPDAEWNNYNYINEDEGVDAVAETHERLLMAGVPSDKLTSQSSEVLKALFPIKETCK